jgi:3-phenylpropionate/cinnamic acid dioxygenase small subunit
MTTDIEAAVETAPARVTPALQFEVEQFLYHEAELLDEWKYRDWWHLFSDDATYRMPVRRNRLRRQRAEDESSERGIEMAHYDDDKASLDIRVKQRESGSHWAEDPPSRSRHLVTNVRVRPSDEEAGSYEVRSYFLCYRNRLEAEVDVWAGERFDRLRPTADGSFQIARRVVLIDQNVILSKNLSIFF